MTEQAPIGITLGGIKIMRNEHLPHGWMVVSPDVYNMLTATPESRKAKTDRVIANIDKLQELIKRRQL